MQDYADLRNLLESYFHQDWDLDLPDEDAVVRQFAQTNALGAIDRAQAQVQAFAAAHAGNLLSAFEAHFPATILIGETEEEALGWLSWLAERLSEYRGLAAPGQAD